MNLTYFPEVFPDELLYSVLARYGRHVGFRSYKDFNRTLLGDAQSTPITDLPNRLAFLAARLPPDRRLDVDGLLRLTLFDYYAHFATPGERRRLAAEMAGSHQVVRPWNMIIARPSRLRFCPECSSGMVECFGELYWRRCHQVPTVVVCPDHGCSLWESPAALGRHSRRFTPASPELTAASASRLLVANASGTLMAGLCQLAADSVALLDGHGEVCPDPGGEARLVLSRKGFRMSEKRVQYGAFRALASEILGCFGQVWPQLFGSDGQCGVWLKSATRSNEGFIPPPAPLLVRYVLDRLPDWQDPFGPGPWPCLNPLSSHCGQLTIRELRVGRNDPDMRIYACRCGYSYSRAAREDGSLTRPRMRTPGRELHAFLLRSVAEGLQRKEVVRATGMSYPTIEREAKRLGVTLRKYRR